MKQPGDRIKPGDILAQIETDKATVDFEMQEEGYIAKLLYPEGAKDVKLGEVVAIVVENADDVEKFKDFSGTATEKPVEKQSPPKEEKRSCPMTMERPQSSPEDLAGLAGPKKVVVPHKEEKKPVEIKAPQIILPTSTSDGMYEDVPV